VARRLLIGWQSVKRCFYELPNPELAAQQKMPSQKPLCGAQRRMTEARRWGEPGGERKRKCRTQERRAAEKSNQRRGSKTASKNNGKQSPKG